jgi:hypothetical protein
MNMADIESGTYRTARGWSAAEFETAFRDLDLALTEVAVCFEFLRQVTSGEPERATKDGEGAMLRIACMIQELRRQCTGIAESSPNVNEARRVG